MTVYYINAITGGGKTTFATFHNLLFNQLYPTSVKTANYHIKNLKNFQYSPAMVLPLESIKRDKKPRCITIDDIKSLPILDFFITIIASISRKASLDIQITGQYYTMFSRELRYLSTYEINVETDKENDSLLVKFIDMNHNNYDFEIHQLTKYVYPFFDTKEYVEVIDEDLIYEQVLKICKTKKDVVQNVASYIKNKKEKKDLIIKLLDELGLE